VRIRAELRSCRTGRAHGAAGSPDAKPLIRLDARH
jgi:hypothetical protein